MQVMEENLPKGVYIKSRPGFDKLNQQRDLLM
jgi:hypothetical protein